IGMDHFALPEDEMGSALESGTLWRNFMGYTVRHAPDTVACGMSAIGDVAGAFVQNDSKLIRYLEMVERGGLAVTRGYLLTPDDLLRRHVITSLMCTLSLNLEDLAEKFAIEPRRHLAVELDELRTFEEDGFLTFEGDRIRVVGLGRLFVRNICMVFDAHLRASQDSKPRFSRTV
ncbi:MAG: coproporphyrinogen III oxidase, partial [Acidobacteria bacterium]|nr:coproporphyrinogen III oxidase [Acidobacteriota bacterium]